MNLKIGIATLAGLLLFGGFFGLPSNAHSKSIVFSAHSEVEGTQILLGDVARFKGFKPEVAGNLYKLKLKNAPKPTKSTTVHKSNIRALLKEQGLSEVKLSFPKKVVVHRSGYSLKEKVVREKIRETLEEELTNYLPAQATFRIETIRWKGDLLLPTGELRIIIKPANNIRWSGSSTVNVIFKVEDEIVKKYSLKITISGQGPLIVAASYLEKGHLITKADLKEVVSAYDTVERGGILDSEQIIGQEVKKPLFMGDVFNKSALQNPTLVVRGELVTIFFTSSNLTITAKGEAIQSGMLGDVVRAKNLETNTILKTLVVDNNIVQVIK